MQPFKMKLFLEMHKRFQHKPARLLLCVPVSSVSAVFIFENCGKPLPNPIPSVIIIP